MGPTEVLETVEAGLASAVTVAEEAEGVVEGVDALFVVLAEALAGVDLLDSALPAPLAAETAKIAFSDSLVEEISASIILSVTAKSPPPALAVLFTEVMGAGFTTLDSKIDCGREAHLFVALAASDTGAGRAVNAGVEVALDGTDKEAGGRADSLGEGKTVVAEEPREGDLLGVAKVG